MIVASQEWVPSRQEGIPRKSESIQALGCYLKGRPRKGVTKTRRERGGEVKERERARRKATADKEGMEGKGEESN